MASLKEVKNRIGSVQTTRKITQARQMVSSAQLHRAQAALEAARAYRDGLDALVERLGPQTAQPGGESPAAVVVMASDAGMCGSFNTRMEREMLQLARERPGGVFYPVGKKMRDAAGRAGLTVAGDFDTLAPKSTFAGVQAAWAALQARFAAGGLSQTEVLYWNFRNTASQDIVRELLLPVAAPGGGPQSDEFIVEPTAGEFGAELLRMAVEARFYAAYISTRASEHAQRMIAMQAATENANDLLDDLQLSYNKLRQQNITSELLDIIGSSFA